MVKKENFGGGGLGLVGVRSIKFNSVLCFCFSTSPIVVNRTNVSTAAALIAGTVPLLLNTQIDMICVSL